MSTFLQQTVNLLKKTERSIGTVDGLSTSDSEILEDAFHKSPIHAADLTRENLQTAFDAMVLNGPADIDADGNIIKPPSGIKTSTMNFFDDEDGGTSPFGAPSVGGEGGTPKGPNLVAGSALAAGAALDDGLASPPVPGASSAGSDETGLAGLPGFGGSSASGAGSGAPASGGGIGTAGAGAGSAGGAGTAGAGGAGLWMNSIYGSGPKGTGGGGGTGGSDNPSDSSKIIGGQGVGNLAMGSSTPTSVGGQRDSAFKSPWDDVIERRYKG